MSEGKRKIDFVLRGRLEGVEITPATIGLSRFNEFNRQAEDFISGSEKQKLDEVTVEIEKGSYRFRTIIRITMRRRWTGLRRKAGSRGRMWRTPPNGWKR